MLKAHRLIDKVKLEHPTELLDPSSLLNVRDSDDADDVERDDADSNYNIYDGNFSSDEERETLENQID